MLACWKLYNGEALPMKKQACLFAFLFFISFACSTMQSMEKKGSDKSNKKVSAEKKGEGDEERTGRFDRKPRRRHSRSSSRSGRANKQKVKKDKQKKEKKEERSTSLESGSSTSTSSHISPREFPAVIRYIQENDVALVKEHGEELKDDAYIDDEENGPFHYVTSVEMFRLLLSIGVKESALRLCNNQRQTPLHVAIRNGLVELVRAFLHYKISLDAQDENGNTPLHEAASIGNTKIIQLLLAGNGYHASDISVRNNSGRTPLMVALERGHVQAALTLLGGYRSSSQLTADLNTPDIDRNYAIFLAIHMQDSLVTQSNQQEPTHVPDEHERITEELEAEQEVLLEESVDNETTNKERSVETKIEVIKRLIEAGARLDFTDRSGRSVLHGVPTAEIAEVLLKHMRSMHQAQITFLREVVHRQSADTLNTPLHEACGPDVVNMLIRYGAEVNRMNGRDRFPVETAQDENVIRALLAHGARVNLSMDRIGCRRTLVEVLIKDKYQDTQGNTLLHMTSNQEIARLCLDEGFDVNVLNNNGQTPLHTTTSPEIAQLLIDRGAHVGIEDVYGNTPLHMVNNEAIFDILLAHGATIQAVNREGLSVYQTIAHPRIRARLRVLLDMAPEEDEVEAEENPPIHPQVEDAVLTTSQNANTTAPPRRRWQQFGLGGSLRLGSRFRGIFPAAKSSTLDGKVNKGN